MDIHYQTTISTMPNFNPQKRYEIATSKEVTKMFTDTPLLD